jgi:hypothetical protein
LLKVKLWMEHSLAQLPLHQLVRNVPVKSARCKDLPSMTQQVLCGDMALIAAATVHPLGHE